MMVRDIWLASSIQIANSFGYLDKLQEIYPVSQERTRFISHIDEAEIKETFTLDDPYIPCLRHNPKLVDNNPETVKRIGDVLFSFDIETLLSLAKQPKKNFTPNGNTFKRWLSSLGYPFLEEKEFRDSDEISFLKGNDKKLAKFAKTHLGIESLDKGVDFIIKIKSNFILGEAKFISDFGGSQTNQLLQALKTGKLIGENYFGILGNFEKFVIIFNTRTNTYRWLRRIGYHLAHTF